MNPRPSAFIRIRIFLPLFFFLLILSSCTKSSIKNDAPLEIEGLTFEKSLPLKYAKIFRIDEYRPAESSGSDGYSELFRLITVADSDRYLLIPEKAPLPKNLPPEIILIQYPVKKTYLCASSAMALWVRLDSLDAIRFSAIQKKDWYIEEAARAMEEKKILYAGKYNAPDFELLLKEKPSLAVESTMIYHSPQIKEKLESLGIPVFVDKSSYEPNPLGRMEWIKLYGAMLGKEREAESFFQKKISALTPALDSPSATHSDAGISPKIAFFYITPNGLVVIRGRDDYIVKMIEMAGGTYAFASTRKSTSPSVTISMEQFYAQCADADILIYNSSIDNSVHSLKDLHAKSPLFAEFKAVQDGSVWATGKYLYQATDSIGDMILDLKAIISGEERQLSFLERVE
ncbi:MAG: ABC transporter substrate-binding protein [Treponema sp.]|uniref:ABC transporter substrate-binding protein n=1 Tax=Treponema sp. TaxID=166 RepID=UPI0025CF47BF|nr:ABC transporter substrate-binding protein [Treponema sp.]MBQ9282231.1 ABC transporter substrate-binding protein [Treponema sp.]